MSRALRRASGFTLIEMLIAPTIALILLSAGIMAGVRLQRLTAMQQQTAELQTAGRAVKELLTAAVASAGAGFGTAAITTGLSDGAVVNGSSAVHYALDGQTGAAFAADKSFKLPTGQYESRKSDAVEVWTGDTDAMVATAPCSGGSAFRVGTTICTATSADALDGHNVLVVNPTLRTACEYEASVTPGVFQVNIAAALGHQAPPAGGVCDLDSDSDSFWSASGAYVFRAASVAYRVNWAGAVPELQIDPDGSDTAFGWQTAATSVEQLRIRQGVIDLTAPANEPSFFPTSGLREAIDQCTDTLCWGKVPGNTDSNDTSAVAALERRVRVIEFDITMRSRRSNPDAVILKSDGTFGTDSELHLTDGYVRRQFVFRVAPRNFRLAGVVRS
jgi:type IV pilus assembly protein PilW